jgi:SOS-response transcriptional repressor LexA
MGFSNHAPLLMSLTVDVATNLSVPHHSARERGQVPRIVRRYLDKGDRNSTSNMHKHAKNCWGEENISRALETKGALSVEDVRKNLSSAKVVDGSITASFERKGKKAVTFSTRQHTYMETRLVDTIIY